MKQILQNLKTGATEIVEVPAPAVGRGQLLIRTSRTLVSAGTERMLVDCGNGPIREDKMSILLGFAYGSVGTVHYFANCSKSYPKETLEVFGDGRVIRMENFRITTG